MKKLESWEINQIEKFKQAVIASEGRCVCAYVKPSASGLSRKIKFVYACNNEILNINHILEIIGYKLNKDGSITRKGCGMDMVFDTLYGLYNALGIEDYSGLACHYTMI